MPYKNKTLQRLHNLNRPGSKLRTIVPTPSEYKAMPEELQRKYRSAVTNWYSKSPSRKASALARFTQLGMYEWENASVRTITNTANLYGNMRTLGARAEAMRENEALDRGVYIAPYGSGYKDKKTQNRIRRLIAFRKTPGKLLKTDSSFVKQEVTTYVFYESGEDIHGNRKAQPGIIMTDTSIPAVNGSPRGTAIHVWSAGSGFEGLKSVMDKLDREGLAYRDEVTGREPFKGEPGFPGAIPW